MVARGQERPREKVGGLVIHGDIMWEKWARKSREGDAPDYGASVRGEGDAWESLSVKGRIPSQHDRCGEDWP